MISIETYLDDGANWQAQCVLAYLRRYGKWIVEDLTWNNEKKRCDGELCVGRCENCREQGYVFSVFDGINQLVHFWVYEHRIIDELCVVEFEGTFINTPTINDIPMKDKHDVTMSFGCGEVIACGEWIVERIKYYINRAKSMDNKNEGEE